MPRKIISMKVKSKPKRKSLLKLSKRKLSKRKGSLRKMSKRKSLLKSKRKRMLKKVLTEQCRSAKIKRTMHEFKTGDLKLVNGKIVTNRKQAIAIALSQANRYC
jgi:hypothetical protein